MWTVYILQCRDGTSTPASPITSPAAWPPTTQAGGPVYQGRTPGGPGVPGALPRPLRRSPPGAGHQIPLPPPKAGPLPPQPAAPRPSPRHRRMLQAHGANFSESCKAAAEAHSVRPPGKSPLNPPFPGGSPSLGVQNRRTGCFASHTAVSDDLPNKSLCVPVRAKVSTSTSSSMR